VNTRLILPVIYSTLLACALLLLAAGCTTKAKAKAQAQAAFLAGQQQVLERMQRTQNQAPSVTIIGPVRNGIVPWNQEMTLAKALLAADYIGTSDPASIIIVHNGIATQVDPKQLLNGQDLPLQAGDVVHLK
jgi:hypothetical protein